MFMIFLFLIMGFILGNFLKADDKMNFWLTKGMDISVFLMLFLMGLSLSKNENVIQNLSKLGITSFFLACTCSICGLFVFRILKKWF